MSTSWWHDTAYCRLFLRAGSFLLVSINALIIILLIPLGDSMKPVSEIVVTGVDFQVSPGVILNYFLNGHALDIVVYYVAYHLTVFCRCYAITYGAGQNIL